MDSKTVEDGEMEKSTINKNERQKRELEVQKKVIVVILFAVVFFAAIFSVVIAISLKEKDAMYNVEQRKLCDKIEAYTLNKILEGTGLNKTPEVVDINRCRKDFGCTFNILSCQSPCPLGFEMEGECATSCKCATHGTMQLDVRFDEDTLPAILEQMDEDPSQDFRVFQPESGIQLWNQHVINGRPRIPYILDDNLDFDHKEAILEAFTIFKDKTCIDFVPRTDQPDYLHIQNGDGDCSASYARHQGQNILNVAACYSYSHVLHVLMHSLGFHHEHMRNDRDAYINIVWDNVDPTYENAFNKLNTANYLESNSEYDKHGIMSLDGYAFSKTRDKKIDATMIDLDTSLPVIGGGSILTVNDLEDVVTTYCNGAPENTLASLVRSAVSLDRKSVSFSLSWTEWSRWSRCQKTCGKSIQTRTRQCKQFNFITYGCKGRSKEGRTCRIKPCDITVEEAEWEEWGPWGQCSRTCGTGIMMKYRKCSVKGACRGKGRRARGKKCNTKECKDDKPHFSEWTSWGECATTCGKSSRNRKRECLDRKGRRSLKCTEGKIDRNGFETEIGLCEKPCPVKSRSSGVDEYDYLPEVHSLDQMGSSHTFEQKAAVLSSKACDPLPNHFWFVGDFNGDGRTDVMCGEGVDTLYMFSMKPDGTLEFKWGGALNCALGHMYVGDFNGDGLDDIFCKDSKMERNFIYKSDGAGFYEHENAGPFCMAVLDKIEVLDVNGDGKADLLCRHARLSQETDMYISYLS